MVHRDGRHRRCWASWASSPGSGEAFRPDQPVAVAGADRLLLASRAGGAAGRRPMPWLGANGLLPGRGEPGRGAVRAAGDAGAVGALKTCSAGSSTTTTGSGSGSGSATCFGPGRGARFAGASSGTTGVGATSAGASAAGATAAASTGAGLAGGGAAAASAFKLLAVLLLEAHFDGKFHRRRGRLDELAHLFELFENKLALDTELFGEFVDSGFSHGILGLLLARAPEFLGTDR